MLSRSAGRGRFFHGGAGRGGFLVFAGCPTLASHNNLDTMVPNKPVGCEAGFNGENYFFELSLNVLCHKIQKAYIETESTTIDKLTQIYLHRTILHALPFLASVYMKIQFSDQCFIRKPTVARARW